MIFFHYINRIIDTINKKQAIILEITTSKNNKADTERMKTGNYVSGIIQETQTFSNYFP